MKKKTLIIYIILILIAIKLPATFLINESFISDYNKGVYNEKKIQKLFFLNIIESYIPHYNYGNVLYHNNNFDKAITEYKKALKKFPPEDKECSIRINLALAMLAKIDENDSKDNIIKSLQEAKEELCDNTCENEKTQNLKNEINNMINTLNQSNEEEQEQNDNKVEENNEEQNKDEIQKQLEEIQKAAQQSRNEDLEYINSTAEQDYYTGKRW